MINNRMELIKGNVQILNDTQQYIIADDIQGNLITSLDPESQEVDSLTIHELGKSLLQAAQNGDLENINLLLSKGAPFTSDWLGVSPLHLAAQHNHLEVCEIFLRSGMCKDTRTKVERTPLHLAVFEGHQEIVECLLKHGADGDARDMLLMTPLHWAAQRGHAEIAAMLIRHGATVNVENKFKLTPIDIAMQNSRSDIVDVINYTTRDPLQATTQLVEINEENNIVEPILDLMLEDEASPQAMPIETVLIDADETQYLQDPTQNQDLEDSQEVQFVEAVDVDTTTSFTESMKLLQQHGITMLPDDDSNILSSVMETGHSVVLTEAGKQALNSIKAEKLLPEVTTAPAVKTRPSIIYQNQSSFKKKKIITVTADQFLAMTGNNASSLKIVNGKLVQGKPQLQTVKKIVNNKHTFRCNNALIKTVSKDESLTQEELLEQLEKSRALAESYRKRLIRTEYELHKYKTKCKFLMEKNNLNI